MTFKTFLYNLILIVAMTAGCIAASYIGLIAAIDHMDARQTAWSVARGEK
jgi:hypothetical protein